VGAVRRCSRGGGPDRWGLPGPSWSTIGGTTQEFAVSAIVRLSGSAYWRAWWDNLSVGQMSLFGRAELTAMRDTTRRRNYSPRNEAFRREHKRHRDWGLTQRHAEKLRQLTDETPEPAEPPQEPTTPPEPEPAPSPEAPADASPSTPSKPSTPRRTPLPRPARRRRDAAKRSPRAGDRPKTVAATTPSARPPPAGVTESYRCASMGVIVNFLS
jgi:outer membrane biosynthesis protein TonB